MYFALKAIEKDPLPAVQYFCIGIGPMAVPRLLYIFVALDCLLAQKMVEI